MQTGRDISPQCALGVEVAADDSGLFFSKLRVPIPTTSVSIQISQGEGYKPRHVNPTPPKLFDVELSQWLSTRKD